MFGVLPFQHRCADAFFIHIQQLFCSELSESRIFLVLSVSFIHHHISAVSSIECALCCVVHSIALDRIAISKYGVNPRALGLLNI